VPPLAIAEAKERFLKDAESGRRLGDSTLRKYRLMLLHLEQFAAKKGFLYLKQLDGESLRQFRDSWNLSPPHGPQDAGTRQSILPVRQRERLDRCESRKARSGPGEYP